MIEIMPLLLTLSYYDYKYQKVPVLLVVFAVIVELIAIYGNLSPNPILSAVYLLIMAIMIKENMIKWADAVLLVPLCTIQPLIFPLAILLHIVLKKLNILKNNAFIPSITLAVVVWMCFYK